MRVTDINHVAIKTLDLDRTNWFYTEVLGMSFAPRPPLGFPGSWLKMGETMIHVFAGEGAFDAKGNFSPGGAAVDHISINAEDFDGFAALFDRHGLDWRENDIPGANIWQLFVKDPNDILIELNFNKSAEPAGTKGYRGVKPFVPGQF